PSGRVYNLSYNPPQRHGYDDITGERLTKRPDDNPVSDIALTLLVCAALSFWHGIPHYVLKSLLLKSHSLFFLRYKEIFKVRLQKHMSLTEPLLEYYAKRNILITCAGRTSDEIYPQIEAELICRFGLGNMRRIGEVVEEDEKRAISERVI